MDGGKRLGGSAAIDELIQSAAMRWLQTPHGGKGEVIDTVAQACNRSRQTVYRLIKAHLQGLSVSRADGRVAQRKRRADAGASCLSRTEARKVSAYLLETRRATGKRLADMEIALRTLRVNGEITAGRLDETTGEFFALSASAAFRRLRQLNLHPDQLTRPAPKVQLASAHPNQVWQIDPSLCVLYYLKREAGLRAMPHDEFYKNKPQNLARIANDRVWRYVVVDHCSGAIYVEYVWGAETGLNLCNCFIHAMHPRGTDDPFCGVPELVMVDPGSANLSNMFRNLCAALGSAMWVNQPHQPWAKGAVEKHNDIVERKFEQGLKFLRVDSLNELNTAAWRWMRVFNTQSIHTRHGMSRYAAWMRITAEQKRLPPSEVVCRRLAQSRTETRVVSTLLRVNFRGHQYDVSGVPGVIVGDKLLLARNAWADEDSAHVVTTDDDGATAHYAVPMLTKDAYGFAGGVPIGTFRQHADTPADVERKAIERVAMDAATDDEAAAKRKAKELPFGGRVDPYKHIDAVTPVAWMPRAGTEVSVDAPRAEQAQPFAMPANPPREFPPMNQMEAAKALKPLVEKRGGSWSPECWARIAERFPNGMPGEALDAFASELARGTRMRVVGGES